MLIPAGALRMLKLTRKMAICHGLDKRRWPKLSRWLLKGSHKPELEKAGLADWDRVRTLKGLGMRSFCTFHFAHGLAITFVIIVLI